MKFSETGLTIDEACKYGATIGKATTAVGILRAVDHWWSLMTNYEKAQVLQFKISELTRSADHFSVKRDTLRRTASS